MTDLVWSTAKPTEPGWYWWRNRDLSTELGKPQICLVEEWQSGEYWEGEYIVYYFDMERYKISEMRGSQWAGPIPRPKEMER